MEIVSKHFFELEGSEQNKYFRMALLPNRLLIQLDQRDRRKEDWLWPAVEQHNRLEIASPFPQQLEAYRPALTPAYWSNFPSMYYQIWLCLGVQLHRNRQKRRQAVFCICGLYLAALATAGSRSIPESLLR